MRWRWLAVIVLLLVTGMLLVLVAPKRNLAAQRALWAARGYADYRIVVRYEVPFYACEQDLEVRAETVTYRYTDECMSTSGLQTDSHDDFIVSHLFQRVENSLTNPPCGANGCACDGPQGIDVVYDPQLGYPQKLVYRAMPELRWSYMGFWQTLLSGNPPCPTSGKGNVVGSDGPTITVLSLVPLKAEGDPDNIPFATPTATP